MLYINRYDWSFHCNPGNTDETFPQRYQAFLQSSTGVQFVNKEGLDPSDIRMTERNMMSTRQMGFMMALDADGFSHDFMQPFLESCPATGGGERIFRKGDDDDDGDPSENFGAFVSIPGTEYELGKSALFFIEKK